MKLFRNILLLVSAMGLLWAFVGCRSVIYDDYSAENDPEDPNLVTLVLNVGLVSPTRAAVDNDREAMHSLRIVLLNMDDNGDNGVVEYNRYISFKQGLTEYKEGISGYQFIRTMPGKKKIFLIANEEGTGTINDVNGYTDLTALFNSVNIEDEGFETLVNSISFKPGNYSGYIPLSSSYAFEVGAKDAGTRLVLDPFYLVHAATKFEFEFVNNRNNAVEVRELSVSFIASDMYLMAHFDKKQVAEEKKVEWRDEFGNLMNKYWIDWLKDVSDATTYDQNDPVNDGVNRMYGWIEDYEIPTTATHELKPIVFSPVEIRASKNIEKPIPVVYFPESKFYSSNSGPGQEYTFWITLHDPVSNSTKTFEKKLRYTTDNQEDNLVALFRNTHVKITCTIDYDAQDITMDLLIGICPWTIEEINIPAFD